MNDREDYFYKNISKFEKHEYNEGDVLKTQLWCLFEYFGSYIDIACDTPFNALNSVLWYNNNVGSIGVAN